MKLDPIRKEHLEQAAEIIDLDGIPKNKIHNLYWVELENEKEYPFKHLTSIAYKIANSNDSESLDFESKPEYRDYIASLGFKINYYEDQIGFFSTDELNHFSNISSNSYRSENPEDVKNGLKLAPLIIKLNKWADRTAPENFNVRNDKSWQWSGTFKSYLWIKIYKEGFQDKIFFICGVGNSGLYLQLNCQRSNHSAGRTKALPNEKIRFFDNFLAENNYQEIPISIDELEKGNWNSLVQKSKNFISMYEAIYDELCILIDKDTPIFNQNINKIILEDSPNKIKSRINDNPSFKGVKIDWEKTNKAAKLLGNRGEELVLNHELARLSNLIKLNPDFNPHKVLDGEGYDILSYSENGKEIYIEVKTTSKGKEEPFYLSLNEFQFLEQNADSYFIYRIFEYNPINNYGKLFIISGKDLLNYSFKPLSFEISSKTTLE